MKHVLGRVICFLGLNVDMHTHKHKSSEYKNTESREQSMLTELRASYLWALLGVRNDVQGVGRGQAVENCAYHAQEFYFV